jgi:hypothetical protein
MSITRAEQMSMNPVLAADSVGGSAASVVMPGGIGVSSSSERPRAGDRERHHVRDHWGKGAAGYGHEIRPARFPPMPHGVSRR